MESGSYFMLGNHALAEGAIVSGCTFFAGYPISPSTEIMEHISSRFSRMADRHFVQMEDEIGSIAAVIGAAWAGAKAMTATSGPGFSLMQENLSYAYATETPLVVVNAMRSGPSTGQSTYPSQQDIYQAKYGAHGDYEAIALAPWSVQEMYDMTIQAFNLSENYRTPVILIPDGEICHMRERIQIPPSSTLKIENRLLVELSDDLEERKEIKPFMPTSTSLVPPMVHFGDGAQLLVTGSAHDEAGTRDYSPETHGRMVRRMINKIQYNRDKIIDFDCDMQEGARICIISFGSSARVADGAVRRRREAGRKVSLIRLKAIWPFPDDELEKICSSFDFLLVVEMNMGKLVREVERIFERRRVFSLPVFGGVIPREKSIENEIEKLCSIL